MKLSELTDDDVVDLITFQRRLCIFCIDAGIPRDAEQTVKGILENISYRTLLASVLKQGVTNAPTEAKRLMNEFTALWSAVDGYDAQQSLIAKRYGLSGN